jgi:diguanylate cyclase (GGDEF)-like protein
MNILVAEDQPPSALFLRRLLERMGHEVTLAVNGEEAWRTVQELRPPLVISDWMMPQLDGPALCRRIRNSSIESYTYIILLTARAGRRDKLEGLKAGADDFLTKPLDPDELLVRLEIATRILAVHQTLARQNAALTQLATTDELTGVRNRRRFREDLLSYTALSVRHRLPLSLIMLDVDGFKPYNDDFGHPAGDDVLKQLAAVLREYAREHDLIARYGGEEFAVLLPLTTANAAIQVAERFRTAIGQINWPHRHVTASFGVATLESSNLASTETLVDQADQALYHSKRAGRDRVTHFRSLKASVSPVIGASSRGTPDPSIAL